MIGHKRFQTGVGEDAGVRGSLTNGLRDSCKSRTETIRCNESKKKKNNERESMKLKWMNVENATKIKFFKKFSEILKETFITL